MLFRGPISIHPCRLRGTRSLTDLPWATAPDFCRRHVTQLDVTFEVSRKVYPADLHSIHTVIRQRVRGTVQAAQRHPQGDRPPTAAPLEVESARRPRIGKDRDQR